MKALSFLPALCLTAGAAIVFDDEPASKQHLKSSWDTSTSCGKAHLGCQMGVPCACHYFQDCNPDSSYTGPVTRAIDECLCEYGWSAYCGGSNEFHATPLEKREKMATVSIVDEHPGHKTLNEAAAEQSPHTKVTLVDENGKFETLIPTTNAHGKIVLATKNGEKLAEAATGTGYSDDDRDHTRKINTNERLPITGTGYSPRPRVPTHRAKVDDDDDDTLTLRPTDEHTTTVTSTIRVVEHVGPTAEPVDTSTITKVMTETVTSTVSTRQCHDCMHSATVASIGNDVVPITKDLQLVHNHTLVKVYPQPPAASLVPLNYDPKYTKGWESVMEMEMNQVQEMFSDMDWAEVVQLAYQVRKHGDHIDEELSMKYALVMLLRSRREESLRQRISPAQNTRMADMIDRVIAQETGPHTTATVVDVGTGSFTMTQSTQTHHGNVYVIDPLNKFRAYDPEFHKAAPTGSCNAHPKRHDNESRVSFNSRKHDQNFHCLVDSCMWNNFMRPINITTAMPMAMYDQHGFVDIDYFTRTTELRNPHWGVESTSALHYPTRHTCKTESGKSTHTVVRATPGWLHQESKLDRHHHQELAGEPKCHDLESCHTWCHDTSLSKGIHAGNSWEWWWALIPIAAIILLSLLCLMLMQRHRRKRREQGKETITEKIRRRSSTPVVVNQVTGQETDARTGEPVNRNDPSNVPVAVIAGSAAGAEAAKEKNDRKDSGAGGDQAGSGGGNQSGSGNNAPGGGDDGKGTTGKRAEEGRGRVNFEDGGYPGGSSSSQEAHPGEGQGQTTTTESKSEAKPAPGGGQTDGTGDASGRAMPDMGSMRGRKRQRPEGGVGLNLGF